MAQEKHLYDYLPSRRNQYHSAVLTSFSFSFHHFENQVLKSLKKAWITSVNIFVDQRMLDDSLGWSSGNLKHIGRTYSVSGIPSTGAFHPKINFFLGDNKILLLYGSGNITPGGHGQNHEIFAGFYADSNNSEALPLLLESWDYLLFNTTYIDGYAAKRVKEELTLSCSLLSPFLGKKHQFYSIDNNLEAALLYNETTSIWEQLLPHITGNEVKTITIVSPYFDKDGYYLQEIKAQFPKANIEIFLQKEFGLPPVEIPKTNISFFDWDMTPRGKEKLKGKISYHRKLHMKIFHFLLKDGTELCVIGSANATKYGIGTSKFKPLNQEFCTLYRSRKIKFLEELEIRGARVQVDVYSLKRQENLSKESSLGSFKPKIRINSIDLNGSKLVVFLNKPLPKREFFFSAHDINGESCIFLPIPSGTANPIEFTVGEDLLSKEGVYGVITQPNGLPQSNKQLVNFIQRLENTSPKESNRILRELISNIESGKFYEFDIIEYVNSLNTSRTAISKITRESSRHSPVSKNEDDDLEKMTYEDAVQAFKNKEEIEKFKNKDPISQLLSALEESFESQQENLLMALLDQEEEAVSSKSHKPQKIEKKAKRNIIVKESAATKKLRNIEVMADNYLKALENRLVIETGISIIDLHQFMLVSIVLTNVCCLTEYQINPNPPEKNTHGVNQESKKEIITTEKFARKLTDLYCNKMLQILTKVVLLLMRKNFNEDSFESTDQQKELLKFKHQIFWNLGLLERKTREEVINDKIVMIGLNTIHMCGTVDETYDNFVLKISNFYGIRYCTPNSMIRFKNNIQQQKMELAEYKLTKFHGYGKVLDQIKKRTKYNTLQGIQIE